MTKRVVLPPPPPEADPQTRQWMEAVREAVDVQLGQRGDPLDRAVTVRELYESGVVKLEDGGEYHQAPPSANGTGFTAAASGDGYNPMADYSAPAPPAALEASGTENTIVLSWTNREQRNVVRTELWVNTVDDRDSASMIGTVSGRVFAWADAVPGTTYYFWVRFVSYTNIPSQFNAFAGIAGVTDAGVPDDMTVNQLTAAKATIGEGEISNLQIGNEIKSTNYVPGVSGWRVDKGGNAELHDVYARGDIEATSLRADSANIIDTLHVRGQAVRFVAAGRWTNYYTQWLSHGVWTTVASKTVDLSTGFIAYESSVIIGVDVSIIATHNGMNIGLFRDGVALATGLGYTWENEARYYGFWVDYPPVGTHTYHIKASVNAPSFNGNVDVRERVIAIDVGRR